LEVIQLGDLFDFWLGFQRAFRTSADDLLPCALDFARFWAERSLFATDQGPHLVHLLTMTEWAGKNAKTGAALNTHFLYGNHDNYRKHGGGSPLVVPAGHEHSGAAIHAFHAPSFFGKRGLWAEHGHQPDPSNRDESPVRGHGLTQVAFFEPAIRNLEGPAGWATSIWHHDNIPRVVSIRHALGRCLLRPIDTSGPCRSIYVMGHSHEPMLKRVELWPRTPRRKT
jgi:hypothetical protein